MTLGEFRAMTADLDPATIIFIKGADEYLAADNWGFKVETAAVSPDGRDCSLYMTEEEMNDPDQGLEGWSLTQVITLDASD
jgi:hypothetical protein